MPFVQRKNSKIVAYYNNRQEGYGEEFIAEDAPELLAHIASFEDTPADKRKLAYQAESDALVIRAIRLQLSGDPGFEAAKKEALSKVAEIKVRIPDLETK
jgi:hypothetical protein